MFGELLTPIEKIPVIGGLAEDVTAMIDHKFASEEKMIEPIAEPFIKPGEEAIGKEVKKIEDEIKHAIEHEVEKGFEHEFKKGADSVEHEVKKGVEKEVGNGVEKEVSKGLEKEVEGDHSSGGFHFGSLFGGR
jgi:hypothetical protein